MDAQIEFLKKVREVVDSQKSNLKKEDFDHIHHLIDHDEPLIALTTFAHCIVESDIKVPVSVVAQIKEYVSDTSEADQLPAELENQITSS